MGVGRAIRFRPVAQSRGVASVMGSRLWLADLGACKEERTYGDFKIHDFLREGAHLVVEAEPIFSCVGGGEYKVALALFLVLHDYLLVRAYHTVVDIERAARLDLSGERLSQ